MVDVSQDANIPYPIWIVLQLLNLILPR